MTTRPYPEGLDCVWLAADCNGNLGAFVTAGSGPVPLQVLNGESLSIEDVEEEACRLPKVSDVRLLVRMKRPDDFIALAERGFFVYDWQDVHRCEQARTRVYEAIALPTNPISMSTLPEPLTGMVVNLKLPNIAFIDELAIDVRKHFEYREPDRFA